MALEELSPRVDGEAAEESKAEGSTLKKKKKSQKQKQKESIMRVSQPTAAFKKKTKAEQEAEAELEKQEALLSARQSKLPRKAKQAPKKWQRVRGGPLDEGEQNEQS